MSDVSLAVSVGLVCALLSALGTNLAFGDRIGDSALEIGVRLGAFVLILVGAALIPAPVRARRRVRGLERGACGLQREPCLRSCPAVMRSVLGHRASDQARVHELALAIVV